MPKKIVIPVFASEAEEAQWLDEHKSLIEREIERRIREGSTLTLRQATERIRRKKDLQRDTKKLHDTRRQKVL